MERERHEVLLYFRGEFLREAMRRQRVAESELLTAIREKKFGSLNEIKAVTYAPTTPTTRAVSGSPGITNRSGGRAVSLS